MIEYQSCLREQRFWKEQSSVYWFLYINKRCEEMSFRKHIFFWILIENKKKKCLTNTRRCDKIQRLLQFKSKRAERSSVKKVDNWITKQPRTFNSIEISGPEASDVGGRIHGRERSSNLKQTVKQERTSGSWGWIGHLIYFESLILAQDERWRRA